MERAPEEKEREFTLARLALLCDVLAMLVALAGSEELAGPAQLLAPLLRLASLWTVPSKP
ncbi:hypothetical protein [Salinispora arenicola]|uniref:hypothetical protein n=1 Tax=Salinispora arenicola TaxID=168697 RepID=UPI00207A8E53|nr:hypothetical protein [Salinispora arenicola]MCN0154882.1 hypothetical protein [Salinispora arenicola]